MTATAMPTQPADPESHSGAVHGAPVVFHSSGALFLPEADALVVSDLHLEKGSSFARRGRLLPPYDTAATLERLALAIARFRPALVICLGDSFHDADGPGRLADADRLRLTALTGKRDWLWISGNHDPVAPVGLPGRSAREAALGGLVFRHEPQPGRCDGEVAGHLHPGARIVRRGRSVRRACFATDGRRLVLPSFGAYTGCLNVLDPAFKAILARAELTAYMLGRQRVYPVAGRQLRGGR